MVVILVKDWCPLILTQSHSFQEKMSLAITRCSETQNAPTWVLHWVVARRDVSVREEDVLWFLWGGGMELIEELVLYQP